jgi:hypothetical protein
MNPGLFDRIISIEQLDEQFYAGSVTLEFIAYKTIRAKFVTKNGAKNQIADQVQGVTTVEFIFNYKDAPLTKARDQVVYNDLIYKIDAVYELPEYGRERYSKIVAQLVGNNA